MVTYDWRRCPAPILDSPNLTPAMEPDLGFRAQAAGTYPVPFVDLGAGQACPPRMEGWLVAMVALWMWWKAKKR